MLADFNSEGTLAHSNLLAGDMPRVSEKQTVLSGAGALTAGAVLAKDSVNANKLVPVNDASATASIQTPYAILADAVDATSADAEAVVYLSGHFNELALTFGGTDTADTHRAALRGLGIYLGTNVGA